MAFFKKNNSFNYNDPNYRAYCELLEACLKSSQNNTISNNSDSSKRKKVLHDSEKNNKNKVYI